MQINGVLFSADLIDILTELQTQLHINGINLLGKIKSTTDNVMICCPYHKDGQERKPSAGIRKSDGLFSCFACHEVHSLPEVISYCFGYTDDMIGAFGWKWLLQNFATIQIEERENIELNITRNSISDNDILKNIKLGNEDKYEANNLFNSNNTDNISFVTEEELDSYRYYHPYWKKRGITDEKVIEMFDLGWSADDNAITFPVRDINGNCLFVAKRSVKTKFFSYPPNSKKSVYGLYELYQLKEFPKEVWITESMIDCIRLWQLGIYACALNGTGDAHSFSQIEKFPCRGMVLATDMDNAGLNARERIRKNVHSKLFKEVFLPKGRKDIGECTDEEILALEKSFVKRC